jgi:hypothetical protein
MSTRPLHFLFLLIALGGTRGDARLPGRKGGKWAKGSHDGTVMK